MTHVLVIGASGFIGRHLTPALTSSGHVCKAATLRSSGIIAEDLAEVDVVIHLAGLAHAGAQGADRQALFNVNVDQTVNLYRQAVAAGVSRFIWLSSIKVLGDDSDAPLAVASPYQPGDDYAASKTAAEQQLLAEPSGTTQLCIVRPPLVYGVGVKANFLSMLRFALSPWPLPLKSANAPRAWLSVHNLVDFLLTLIQAQDLPSQSIWHVRDAEETSVTEMLDLMASQAGRTLRQWTLPGSLALNLAKLVGKRDVAARLFLPLQVDMSDTRALLAWQPVMSQAQAIDEVVKWYQTR